MNVLYKLLGYCPYCGRLFQFTTKRRRQSTAYVEDEKNYIICCQKCFDNIEEHWDEMWRELYKEQMLGLNTMR